MAPRSNQLCRVAAEADGTPDHVPWRRAAAGLWWRWPLGPPCRLRVSLCSSCWCSLASHKLRPSFSLSGSRRRAATTNTSISRRSPVWRVAPIRGRMPEVRRLGTGPGRRSSPRLVPCPDPGVAETSFFSLRKECFRKVNCLRLRGGSPRRIEA